MRRLLVISLLLLCGSAAVAAVPPRAPDKVAVEPSLERGLLLQRAGQLDEAVAMLRRFVATTPPSVQANEAWLALAHIALQRREAEDALLYLGQIPPAQATLPSRLTEGAALIAAGRVAEGVALLQALAPQVVEPQERQQLLVALADGRARLGSALEAVVLYQQASQLATLPAVRERYLDQAHTLLRDRLSDVDLAEAVFMLDGTPAGLDARLQQAQRAVAAGDAVRAMVLAEGVVASPLPFPYRNDALLLVERLSGKAWLKRSIGVLLPLSGRYGTFGTLVRRGMELAVEEHNAKYPPVEFLFRDAGTEPEENARLVSHLANQDRVMAIAGPLTGAAAVAAATRAQQERVPLLALSQRDGIPETGEYIFRNSLTSQQQVRALVRYAVEKQGLRTFAILAPENKMGAEMAGLFRTAVQQAGGEIVAEQSYAETATDFRRQIKLLKGENPDLPDVEVEIPQSGPNKGIKPPPVPLPFQAVFLPDESARMAQVTPQLAFYGIEGAQLLGINVWNSPDLVKLAGRFVEGAVFPDGFFRYSPYPFVQAFVHSYTKKYQEEPSILEAQGYDAAGILLSLMERPDVRSREGLRIALSQLRNYVGVTGATAFAASGEAEKELYLLQVKNGNIVQLN
jgi:ABC-type branched-subunit amino acid transport system substrate-binding protein